MITPADIQAKQFTHGVRGYREEEVDAFLDQLTIEFEGMLKENKRLQSELDRLNSEIEQYKGSEGAVLNTLEAAKALMGDISASAEKRASILLKNAELDAALITREARENAEKIREENTALTNRFNSFRERYKSMLENELARFDLLSEQLFDEIRGYEGGEGFVEVKPAPAADGRETIAMKSVGKKGSSKKGVKIDD